MSIVHVAMELVNTPTKTQHYLTDIPYFIDLYRITIRSLKIVLNIKQFDASREWNVTPTSVKALLCVPCSICSITFYLYVVVKFMA